MREPTRPRLLIMVAGTATEVGKTWVTFEAASTLRRDLSLDVAARKPAQSFEPDDDSTDADLLASATRSAPFDVCPEHRWYPTPMAPPMAADALGLGAIELAALASEVSTSWPGRAPDIGFVELAGGLRSPMAHDGDGIDLIAALEPDLVVLVADAGLGTINSVRLSVEALATTSGATRTIVMLNRFDDSITLHRDNRQWLITRDGFEVVTSINELVSALHAALPRWCAGCGRRANDCDGNCLPPLDPPRHCPICGRKVVVTIVPTGTTTRCKTHGIIDNVIEPSHF